jgi:hypothetical protein
MVALTIIFSFSFSITPSAPIAAGTVLHQRVGVEAQHRRARGGIDRRPK